MIKKYGQGITIQTEGGAEKASRCAVVYNFSSISEFVNYIKTAPLNPNMEEYFKKDLSSSRKGWERESFTKTKSLEEALDIMTKGWDEGANKIEKGLKESLKVNSQAVSSRQRSVYDVIGGNASVPRYLQGVPTNMIRQVRQPVKEKIVDVNIDVCFTARTTTEEMIQNCIKQLQRVVNLENSGVRTNVYVCRMTAENGVAELVRICVKKSTERLNVLKISFPCAHPSMLRRLLFAFDERCPELPGDWYMGYGYATRLDKPNNGTSNIDVFLSNATRFSKEEL